MPYLLPMVVVCSRFSYSANADCGCLLQQQHQYKNKTKKEKNDAVSVSSYCHNISRHFSHSFILAIASPNISCLRKSPRALSPLETPTSLAPSPPSQKPLRLRTVLARPTVARTRTTTFAPATSPGPRAEASSVLPVEPVT